MHKKVSIKASVLLEDWEVDGEGTTVSVVALDGAAAVLYSGGSAAPSYTIYP